MLRSASKGGSFSSDMKDGKGIRSSSVPKSSQGGGWFSPMRYLQSLGAKVARAISLVSLKSGSRRRRSSSKVSSSNSTISSRPSFAPLDSYQAEAIEDCIEFINSSSSFQRSNSISAH